MANTQTPKHSVTPQDWSAALRSGKYTQCRGSAREKRTDGTYGWCCLSVLADLVNPDMWSPTTDDQFGADGRIDADGRFATVTFGTLDSDLGTVPWLTDEAVNKAINLNDLHGETFNQIADWIDAGMPTEDA